MTLAERAGMGEFSSGELRKSNSRKQEEEDAEQDTAQLELQPLFHQQQQRSDSAGAALPSWQVSLHLSLVVEVTGTHRADA